MFPNHLDLSIRLNFNHYIYLLMHISCHLNQLWWLYRSKDPHHNDWLLRHIHDLTLQNVSHIAHILLTNIYNTDSRNLLLILRKFQSALLLKFKLLLLNPSLLLHTMHPTYLLINNQTMVSMYHYHHIQLAWYNHIHQNKFHRSPNPNQFYNLYVLNRNKFELFLILQIQSRFTLHILLHSYLLYCCV